MFHTQGLQIDRCTVLTWQSHSWTLEGHARPRQALVHRHWPGRSAAPVALDLPCHPNAVPAPCMRP